MKYSIFLLPIIFAACQTLYTYRLPNESEKKIFKDSLHWGYSGNVIASLPVVDIDGRVYRLAVTPKTKIEVKTTYGDIYRFYIQSITISGEEGIISTQSWTGYELLSHTQRTLLVHEISEMKILSDDKAATPIGRP